jgi:PAS domain S-box-containing protein
LSLSRNNHFLPAARIAAPANQAAALKLAIFQSCRLGRKNAGARMGGMQERLKLESMKDVLALAVRGASFDALLASLLQAACRMTGDATMATLYVTCASGDALELAASIGMDQALAGALARVPVGEQEAACGRAAHLRQPVIVADIQAEPRMAPWRTLALAHGINACWSFPLHAPGSGVIGTLAFYHRDSCAPAAGLGDDIAYFSDLAALVVQRYLRERDSERRDAEARQQLAQVAAESERRRRLYEAILSATPDLVYVFDLDHRFIYANAVLLQMWGRSWDESIGKNCLELGYPDWHAAMHDREIEQVKATRKPIRGEVPFNGTFGRRIYDYIFVPVLGPDGEVEAVAGTTRDVTERKEFEEELLASQQRLLAAVREAEGEKQRLAAFLEAAPVGTVYVDAQGKPALVNAESKRLWGDAPAIDLGASGDWPWRGWWADGSARDGQPLRPQDWATMRALRGEEVKGDLVEIERFDAERSRRHVVMRAAPIRDAAGTVTGAVMAQMDISDRRRAERALLESEQRFRTITNAMPQMVWTALPDGRIDYHNDQFYQFVGARQGEVEGTAWADAVLHPDDRQAGREIWQRSVARGEPYEMTYRLRHHSGEYRWILARALPVRGADGRILKWMGTDTDIHEKKLAEDALQDASRRKDEFLAMLAHELRNPLAPISAAAQVLRMTPDDPARVRSFAEVIGRQVNHMTSLVNDLLDVSRVTRGMVQYEKAETDLRGAILSAAEQVQPLVEARRHTLALELGPDGGRVAVMGDRARLIQVFANLLANAAKYTQPGGRIAVALEQHGGRVQVAVSDNGSGIDAALLPHVFDLFTQGARTPDRAQGGLGLGLALARTIVLAHGGRIQASSDGPGQGSRFTVDLPLAHARAAGANEGDGGAATGGAALSLVLVDDNIDAVTMLAALLAAAGHKVESFSDPRSALAAAPAAAPDAFILDIGMPGMDGYELARRLRAQPACRDALYVALTGYGQDGDREQTRQAGFDHHFVKPVDAGQLLAALRQRMPRQG